MDCATTCSICSPTSKPRMDFAEEDITFVGREDLLIRLAKAGRADDAGTPATRFRERSETAFERCSSAGPMPVRAGSSMHSPAVKRSSARARHDPRLPDRPNRYRRGHCRIARYRRPAAAARCDRCGGSVTGPRSSHSSGTSSRLRAVSGRTRGRRSLAPRARGDLDRHDVRSAPAPSDALGTSALTGLGFDQLRYRC